MVCHTRALRDSRRVKRQNSSTGLPMGGGEEDFDSTRSQFYKAIVTRPPLSTLCSHGGPGTAWLFRAFFWCCFGCFRSNLFIP